MGLITRVPSETDHRKVMITLTAKGKAMKEPAAEIPLRLVKKMNIDVEKTNIDEINQLKSKLSQLISLLKKIEQ